MVRVPNRAFTIMAAFILAASISLPVFAMASNTGSDDAIQALTSHDPITIDGNADFAAQAALEGWPGNGTETNPYIIQNYTIFADPPIFNHTIKISYTTVNFTIQNCVLKESQFGAPISGTIILFYVKHGRIYNVTLDTANYEGIKLFHSEQVIIENNIAQASWNAIHLSYSQYNKICNNTAWFSGQAPGAGSGITLSVSLYNIVENNKVYGNKGIGIQVYSSSYYNVVRWNIVENNPYGISTTANSFDNLIYNNDFINNDEQTGSNVPPLSNDFNSTYDIGGNYWSNYTDPDVKWGPNQDKIGSDGIVDSPFIGDDGIVDFYPLVESFASDSIKPILSWVAPVNNSYHRELDCLDFDIWDRHLAGVNYSVNGGSPVELRSPYDIQSTSWADGQYDGVVWANDSFGNTNSSFFHVAIDSHPPTISMTSPVNGSTINSGTYLTFDISDANTMTVTYSVNAGPPAGFNPPYTMNTTGWSDGVYTITIRAVDQCNNSRASWYLVRIDDTVPQVISTQPTANATGIPATSSIVVTFSEPMDTASVERSLTIRCASNSTIVPTTSYVWNAQYTSVTIRPTARLMSNTTYQVTVGAGSTDTIGNHLGAAYSWSFTVLADFDYDRITDPDDPDDDNDGWNDTNDAFPFDPNEWLDTDGDGTGNNADPDDDDDGIPDGEDEEPLVWNLEGSRSVFPIILIVILIVFSCLGLVIWGYRIIL